MHHDCVRHDLAQCVFAEADVLSARRPGVIVVDRRANERAFIPTGLPNQTMGDPSHPLVGLPSHVDFGIGDERSVPCVRADVSLYRIRLKVNGYHAQYAGRD